MSEEMNFDLPEVSVPVTVRGKGYTLREATEAAVLRYRAAQARGAKMVDGKVTADLERVYESQSLLVSLALVDGDDKPVPLAEIQKWPAHVVRRLFEKAKEIGRVDEAETAEQVDQQIEALQKRRAELGEGGGAKKGPSGGTDTSGLRIASG